MRELLPAPHRVTDAAGVPAFGSYRGAVSDVDFAPSPIERVLRQKRWVYVALVSDPFYVGAAIVRMGYASKLFAFVYDARARAIVGRASSMAPALAAKVGRSSRAETVAAYRFGRDRARFGAEAGGRRSFELHAGSVTVEAELGEGPPEITAVGRLTGGGRAEGRSLTEKGVLLPLSGRLRVLGVDHALDGFGAYDYTSGILQRRTAWRWAFAMGRDTSGAPVAMNLVEGFMGEPECALFTERDVHPVGEGRLVHQGGVDGPLGPWRVTTTCGAVALDFEPGAEHAEHTNLAVVKSAFHQPVGTFSGEVRAGGRTYTLRDVLGVTEDQSVVW